MSYRYTRKQAKLCDCQQHGVGSGAELFIVEGDSAAHAVTKLRNPQTQAVLPMQGKPMNALKASASRVADNALFQAFVSALGAGNGDSFRPEQRRFETLVLLFDPDADGIHSGALMMMFLHRFMPALLATEHVLMVRPPLFRISTPNQESPWYASSEHGLKSTIEQLEAAGLGANLQTLRYRGLGSLEDDVLLERCIDPVSRQTDVMREQDAQMAIQVFG